MECIKTISKRILLLIMILSMFAFFGTYQADAASAGTVSKLSNVTDGIKVTWTKDTKKAGYKIYRKAGSASKWTLVKKITKKSTTSWTDKKVNNGTKYRYKVRAYKGSKLASTTKYLTTYRLTKAKILSLKSSKPGEITIIGGKNSKATGFQVKYDTDKNFGSPSSKYYSGNKLSRTLTGLTQNKTVYVKIRAYKKVNGKKYYGKYSAVSSVRVKQKVLSCSTNEYQKAIVDEAYRIYNRGNTTYAKSGKGEYVDGQYRYDCSGFASSVLNSVMKKYWLLYKVTASCKCLYETGCIYNKNLKGEFCAYTVCSGKWDPSKVKPGDLLFFNRTGTTELNHVGIYLGDGKFMHSTDYKLDGVGISEMTGSYVERFKSAKRFYPEKVIPAEAAFTVKSGKTATIYWIEKEDYMKGVTIAQEKNKVKSLKAGEKVTVLFTNEHDKLENESNVHIYAYVRYGDNNYGFIYDPWEKLE